VRLLIIPAAKRGWSLKGDNPSLSANGGNNYARSETADNYRSEAGNRTREMDNGVRRATAARRRGRRSVSAGGPEQ